MTKIKYHGPVRVVRTDRIRSSKWGNPRFCVTFNDGTCRRTAPDADVAYGIENREYRENDCEYTLDHYGNITYLRVMKS